uniref:LITAF domain-containing protein n=1 Tax=Timspurckia oligopyrenoides TaxID=708627 RepID=A0A7S1EUH4_9RHOD|mmetsp:Transcript_8761/g.15797  ORF Transcript_8761/g.15797 Transcript_8761/m.15797 type:complete len:192 (+) Transcript_8761:136-711(+)
MNSNQDYQPPGYPNQEYQPPGYPNQEQNAYPNPFSAPPMSPQGTQQYNNPYPQPIYPQASPPQQFAQPPPPQEYYQAAPDPTPAPTPAPASAPASAPAPAASAPAPAAPVPKAGTGQSKSLGWYAVGVECPNCGQNQKTRVEIHKCTLANWLICLFVPLGWFVFCCPLDCGSRVDHSCSRCGAYVGTNHCV